VDPTAVKPRGRRRGRYVHSKKSTLFAIGAFFAALLPPLAFVVPADAAGLTNMAWEASSSTTGATGVTYSYTFTVPTMGNLSSFTMSVPAGTTGTPTIVSASAIGAYAIGLSGQSVSLSGTTLTFSFGSVYFQNNPVVSLKIGGLTNTTTPGSYTSAIATRNGGTTVDSGTTPAFAFTATALTDISWTASSTQTGAASVNYAYGLTTTTASTLSSIAFTVPPGTAGTPTLVSATPSAIGGGTLTLSGTTLSYTFTSTSVAAGTAIRVRIGGLTNTSTAGTYSKVVITRNAGAAVDSGLTAPLSFTSSLLSGLSWSVSSTAAGATGASYTYGFTTRPTGQNMTGFTLSLPPGTSGTPSIGSLTANAGYNINIPSPTITRSGTLLTVAFSSTYLQPSTVVAITVNGLTNTSNPGTYRAAIATMATSPAGPYDSGTTPDVTFVGQTSTVTNTAWTASATNVNATGVVYTFGFALTENTTMDSVTLTVPAGTAGTPAVGTVTPASIAGGTVALSGQQLTYSFPAKTLPTGTTITLQFTGLTNTPTRATIASTIVVYQGATTTASGTTPSVSFTAAGLSAMSWASSSTVAGASDAAYTFGFTTGTQAWLDKITMTVPSGTSGTPTLGVTSFQAPTYAIVPAAQAISLSGTTLTMSFTSVSVPANTIVSIEVLGLSNTPTAGDYKSQIVTYTPDNPLPGPVDSGTTQTVTFTAITLTALSWSATSTSVGVTNVDYNYSFGLSATATISSITMSVPPGTGGTPTVGTVSPSAIAGGTVTLVGQLITYTLPSPVSVNSTNTLNIQIRGITNSSTPSIYAASIIAYNGTDVVASATTPSVTFTSTVLTSLAFNASSTTTDATNVTYTFGLTTSAATISSITMTVPSGTSGTPGLGTITIYDPNAQSYVTPANQQVSRSGTTITYSFTAQYFGNGTTFLIGVTGLKNTSFPGTYTSAITTKYNTTALASGTSPTLSLSSTTLGTPIWSVSSTAIGGTGTVYGYEFVISNVSSIGAITMSLPAGTSGTPVLQSVSPSAIAGGTLSIVDKTLIYSFPATLLPIGTAASISVSGMTNTTTEGTYTSTITVMDSGTAILASGVTTSVTFTSTVLTGLSWTQSSKKTNATGVTYQYGFTAASNHSIDELTLTVPNGTGGTPTLGSITITPPPGQSTTLPPASLVLVGTTLHITFTATWIPSGTAFAITVLGMTNAPSPGNYTSAISTKNSGGSIDSGTTTPVTFVGGPLAATSWTTDRTVAGTDKAVYGYGFTTASTAQLSSVTMTVPPGTSGTPVLSSISPAIAAGASVALAGSVLTVSFTPVMVNQGTAIAITISGLINSTSVGTYTSTVSTRDASGTIDTAQSNTVTLVAQSLALTTTCLAPAVYCTVDADGSTRITLLMIPGISTPSVASVALAIQTNAPNGYRVLVQATPLTLEGGTATIAQAPTTGSASAPDGRFAASATLTPAVGSGAALCSPYGSSTPYVGYSTGTTAASLWAASGPTGSGWDTVVLTNTLRLTATQPAGIYTGTIRYTIQPMFTGNTAC